MVTMEIVPYGGWKNCVRLSNGQIELIATTDVGPRIIRLGFVGGQNFFAEFPDQLGLTGGNEWNIFGGHRLWHAPEDNPRTYSPDNELVPYRWQSGTLYLLQEMEGITGFKKQLEVRMSPSDNRVTVQHRLINLNLWPIEVAPWALSVMAPGGRAIIPQEDYRPHPRALLPARPIVLWHYTNMADQRWTWGRRFIQLRQDPHIPSRQKIGLLNKQGWMAYALKGELFIKQYPYDARGTYPDYNCNTEVFTMPEMLELETLGPLVKLETGGETEHQEVWNLHRVDVGENESDIENKLLPLIRTEAE